MEQASEPDRHPEKVKSPSEQELRQEIGELWKIIFWLLRQEKQRKG